MTVFWWVGLDLVFLVGRAASSGVFWGVCKLRHSLSVNAWGCVSVLQVVWHGAWGVLHWSLLAVGCSWVLTLRWRSLGMLLLIDSTWGWEVSGGPMS